MRWDTKVGGSRLVIAGIETPEPHDREGGSNQDAASHVIAEIGKAKNLPLINA